MNKSLVSLVISTAAVLIMICTLIVISDQKIVRIVAVAASVIALIGGFCTYIMSRKYVARQLEEQTVRALDLLQRKRHDWMNGIQVLYGYSKLRKHDRVLENIESLSEELKRESNISKLDDPKLEWFLHEYASNALKFEFDIEVQERIDFKKIRIDRKLLFEIVSRTADLIDRAAHFTEQEESHYFTLNLDTLNNNVCISCHYDGVYDEDIVRTGLEKIRRKVSRHQSDVQLTSKLAQDFLFIEIKLPYRT